MLSGSITDSGAATSTTEGFVWGSTTSYGATITSSGNFGTGSFSASLSSLACSTTYHYAAYATNGYGTSYGNDETFTTSACPVAAPSGGGGMIVGSGPTAPSAAGVSGYTQPRPQIDYPNGRVVYLNATSSASTPPATTPIPTSSPNTPAAPSTSYQFTINRQLWDEGPDILALQQFLNTHGFPLVSTGWGSPGNETDTFGLYTYAALIKFQQANNLPATGFFGPLTRAAIAGMSTTTVQ
jgi:peptidoglycan hydrolase-like protein with peptidoglycan-binding domain